MLAKSVGFEVIEIGHWGNDKYINYIFKNNGWPNYNQVCDENQKIQNTLLCTVQTWGLFKK
jgi:hypothetical protein